jgi:TolB protein
VLRSIVFLLPLLGAPPFQTSEPASLGDWRVDVFSNERRTTLALDVPPGADDARELEQVLRADLAFASVLRLLDPSRHPRRAAKGAIDYHAWEAAGADLLVAAELSRKDGQIGCRLRIHAPKNRTSLFSNDYRAPPGEARRLAHRIADDLLEKLGVAGIAETRIAFVRDGGPEGRALYRMDYDGARQEAVTGNEFLLLSPRWHPDGSGVTFVSFPTKGARPVLSLLRGGERRSLFASGEGMVFSSAWSPDGERFAFASSHEGNAEIYVMRRDGSGLRRLTDHPGIDVSPSWSPTGREIAFTSNRGGSPQIYTMDDEGLNLQRVSFEGSYNAEPAWSPSREVSEIAYTSRASSRSFDIVVLDLLTRRSRRLTSDGSINDSPSWAPNGQHLVFSSTRTGSPQIFTVHRDGSGVTQLTREGENRTPSWSPR